MRKHVNALKKFCLNYWEIEEDDLSKSNKPEAVSARIFMVYVLKFSFDLTYTECFRWLGITRINNISEYVNNVLDGGNTRVNNMLADWEEGKNG